MKVYKYIIMILVSFISCNVTKAPVNPPDDVTAKVHTVVFKCKPYEYGVLNYQVQKSRNGKNSWNTLPSGTITPKHLPDTNIYQIQIPKTSLSNYYRLLIATLKNTYTSKSEYLSNSGVK